MSVPRLILLLLPLLALAACGGDSGGSAPTAPSPPPPPQPLSWTGVPGSATLKVGEQKQISLSLTAAVTATYTHSASNANVTLAGESPRAGIYRLQITGVEPGETTITVTATAAGYQTATATFPVMVDVRPLAWTDVPESTTVTFGDRTEISLSLSEPVTATFTHAASNANAEVTGASPQPGIYRLQISGVEPGETTITVTATAAGYQTAMATFRVMVDLRPLAWTDVPESETVTFGERTQISLSLSEPAAATYTHAASNANVEITGASPRAGIYRLQISGVEPGETTITVTATAAGYQTAAATFPVTVDVRPLAWTDVPETATVTFGERTEISLSLSEPANAAYTHSASNANVEVTGASPRAGTYRLQITGVAPGETEITVTATAPGYQTATATFPVTVDVRPLAWTDVPESETVTFGERTEISLLLSEPVAATYTHSASTANVEVTGASPRAGTYRLQVTGVEPGETEITVTAMAAGYETATATFPVTVELQSLSWTDVPESETIEVGERKEFSLSLSAPVAATYEHSAGDGIVEISGVGSGTGTYRLRITGEEAGETTVTVTAMAHGHETATASFPLTVELRPLEWTVLPDEIEMEVGEERTVQLELNRPVRPELGIETPGDLVAAAAECVIGACEMTLRGLAGGESVITVTATADGYTEAQGEIEVFVNDPFDPALWRELVFDAFDCPSAASSERCQSRWGERTVEDRITAVLPVQPSFHILTRAATRSGTWQFTRRQIDTIEEAIHDAVEQLTGAPFNGRITTGTRLKDEYGWVDVVPLGAAFWDGRPVCGAARVGATEGQVHINTDRLDDCDLRPVMMHEVGHALGFFHVLNLGDYLMSPLLTEIPAVFSGTEQFHARLAFGLGRGAPYTPDPRKTSATSLLTTDVFAIGPLLRIEELSLERMVQCPLH
ncbi:MAG: hypothetical protein OXI45_08185 [Acidobacteriota bacterium]|nr:hypothetical protein [Acidobacteriota bacterium]